MVAQLRIALVHEFWSRLAGLGLSNISSMFFHFMNTRPSSHSIPVALRMMARVKLPDFNSVQPLLRTPVRTRPSSASQMAALHAGQWVSGKSIIDVVSRTIAFPHWHLIGMENFMWRV